MIEKLKQSSGKVVGVKLVDKITDQDFKSFIPEVEKLIAEHGNIRLLVIVDYPERFEPKATWDDLVFWVKDAKYIERLAIVGQKDWEKWLALLEKPFLKTEVKYYNTSRLQDAWSWLRS